jgi:hypothetical protein
VTTFGSEALERALATVRRRFPDAEVLDGSRLFKHSADWRLKWPAVVRTLDRLIFIADQDGIIGAGVFQEVLDARFRGAAVEYLTAPGGFVGVEDVIFRMVGTGDASRFARVRVSRSR